MFKRPQRIFSEIQKAVIIAVIMNFYYVPLFATLFGLITSTNSFTPPNVTLKNSVQIWYCPLDVQATLSPDRASIDLSYTTPQSQQNSLSQQFACFTQLRLDFQAGNNAVTMNEIQYEGGLKSDEGIGEVETRATWSYVPTVENGVNGPVKPPNPAFLALDNQLTSRYFRHNSHLHFSPRHLQLSSWQILRSLYQLHVACAIS